MTKTTFSVEGMMCGMCEAHVNDCVRKTAPGISKVTSSHSKGETVVISDEPVDTGAVKAAIEATGYKVLDVKEEPYEKKKFSLF